MRFGHVAAAMSWALAFAAGIVHAQSSELEGLLEQPIVSAPSKQAESATVAPATTTIITAEELRTYGIRTLDEAINFLSLGMVATSPLTAVEVGARGVLLTGDYGNHVLLLIDGTPQNEPWNGTAYFERGAGIPFELVDHIEVILGPGSVMHGSQAMLGVINVVTKRARDHAGLHLIAEGDGAVPTSRGGAIDATPLSAWGYGGRAAAGYGREFMLFGAPSELTLQVEYYAHDGADWELGPQATADDSVTGQPKNWGPRSQAPGVWGGTARDGEYVRAPAAYARMRSGDVVATLRGSMYERGLPYQNSLSGDGGDFDDPDNRELDRFLQASLGYDASVSERVTVAARAHGMLYDYQWWNDRSAPEQCPNGLLLGCRRHLFGGGPSGGGDLQTTISVPELRSSTLIGLDGRVRSVSSNLELRELGSGDRVPDENVYSHTDGLIAPYLQESISPLAWLDLSAGLRLDHDTRFGSHLSPRGAVGVTPWENGRLKVIYAEAFRAPTAYELSYADLATQVPPNDLGPESVRSVEVSIEQRFGLHRVFVGAFRSWWFDMVSYGVLSAADLADAIDDGALVSGTSEGYRYENLGTIDNYGLNGGYEGAALGRRLRFGMNLTGAHTRSRVQGGPSQALAVAPSVFGNARVSYAFGRELPTLALAAQFLARRPADRAFDGGFTESPYAPPDLRLRSSVTGDFPGVSGLSYRLSVTFAAAERGAYVIGPNLYAPDASTRAELQPAKRLQGFVGLQYVP